MLKTKDNSIINSESREVCLRGVNLGGWLMMEGYILHGRNIAEKIFKSEFKKRYGRKELNNFTELYRNNFINESDFKNISSLGFNCIRLPFNYRLIENEDGLNILKKAVKLCEKYNIYCILDMHAAPGCQNEDWHADSEGKAELWTNSRYQEKFFGLWELLADTFKDKEIVAGYDILNEPVIKSQDAGKILRNFYIKAVKRIRGIDKGHMIFLEGNTWSQVLEHIGEPFAENLSYSAHFYHPLEFVFNFQTGLGYPGDIFGEQWGRDTIKRRLELYYDYSKKWNIPIFMGEFGVNARGGYYGEYEWVRDTISCFRDFKFHWTYWTYKAIANSVFPDGIYQYLENPAWVSRQGPVCGFETFYSLWENYREDIAKSWKTENFTKNEQLFNLLASLSHI
ncbi:MAG: cellulase family glycosylhydrolase [Candidatus Omnitrophota bacterium]|nr:cellulase family glycosylhydrolase [Candidatus Omnitrophota bacterium]